LNGQFLGLLGLTTDTALNEQATALKFEKSMKPLNEMSILYSKENQKLVQIKDLLLSKLATIEN
jgi:hypothetical protein